MRYDLRSKTDEQIIRGLKEAVAKQREHQCQVRDVVAELTRRGVPFPPELKQLVDDDIGRED